jgi:adenylate kinase
MASVDELKKLVSRLESRIEQLETKITGQGGSSASEDGMRMIIMGPPGAGTLFCLQPKPCLWDDADEE